MVPSTRIYGIEKQTEICGERQKSSTIDGPTTMLICGKNKNARRTSRIPAGIHRHPSLFQPQRLNMIALTLGGYSGFHHGHYRAGGNQARNNI